MLREDLVPDTPFKIFQDTELFCYGTDALLLSTFATSDLHHIKSGGLVADLGCGNGIIPLVLAQKSKAKKITGVELQKASAELAVKNVNINNLQEKIEIINEDLKNVFTKLEKNSFDAVVTNPPYFSQSSGVENESEALKIARHQTEETNELFIKTASLLLKSQGSFFMINRPSQLPELLSLMQKNKLQPKHLQFVHPSKNKAATMVLIHAVKSGSCQLTVEPAVEVKN